MDHLRTYYAITTVLMAVSALFLPFWATLVIGLVGVFIFENFYPALIIVFVMDILYSLETIHIGPFFGSLTIFSIIIYVVVIFLKERVIIHK